MLDSSSGAYRSAGGEGGEERSRVVKVGKGLEECRLVLGLEDVELGSHLGKGSLSSLDSSSGACRLPRLCVGLEGGGRVKGRPSEPGLGLEDGGPGLGLENVELGPGLGKGSSSSLDSNWGACRWAGGEGGEEGGQGRRH